MAEAGSLDRPEDVGAGPAAVVRRWLSELELAEKRERGWNDLARKCWERYRQVSPKKHSFNILYSNTETLSPAVYNKPPIADVRRRFPDADPVARVASDVVERALQYSVDSGGWHEQFQAVVTDLLLPGRGVARVRYVPSMAEVGVSDPSQEEQEDKAHEADEGSQEELAWQQVDVEHVIWDDFRHGPGRDWQEVQWIAFRHRLTRDELVEKFGSEGEKVPLENVDHDNKRRDDENQVLSLFRTAEVWEIWDKSAREVLFIAAGNKDKPLKTEDDPLQLKDFYPIPRPLLAIADSAGLVPTPIYEIYREQAEELDRVSARINKITDAMRARGAYDSTLSELSGIMKGADGDLIPLQDAAKYADRGGLDKAIFMMPIETLASVVEKLYVQREQVKQTIYEITGVSDIIRGSTVASETATAQQIKSQWGTLRLQKMQREVQRFIRDCFRIAGEIIGQQFLPETLQAMTGVKLMTQEQKMQAQMQVQPRPQMPGMPPPPPITPEAQQMIQLPAWEEVLAILRSDLQREFRIDVETDSTVADAIGEDMDGMSKVIMAITQTVQGLGPAVQIGMIPIDGLKEICRSIARRARMGQAVEDALDKIEPPKPQADPAAQKFQMEQQKAQFDAQLKQQQKQSDLQVEQLRMQLEQQRAQNELQMENARLQAELAMERARTQAGIQLEREKAAAQIQIKREESAATIQVKQQEAAIHADQRRQDAEVSRMIAVENAEHQRALDAQSNDLQGREADR